MQVTIKYRAHLAELTKMTNEPITHIVLKLPGQQHLPVSIKDVLRYIKSQYGIKACKLAKTMLIVVNGQSILLLKHFKTVLKDGDEVSFFPICGGG